MNTAHIYVIGSGNPHTRKGFARVLIEQDSRKRPVIFNYEETTYKRSQIQGMIDAVLQLDCPHHVVFISASPLALEKAEIAKGCTYAFDFRAGKGKEINKLLADHNV